MKVGEKAPDFELENQNGRKFKLANHRGKFIMLVFYPKDDSPVCTKQLCSYNEYLEQFNEIGILTIAISTDTTESHRDFASKYNLGFPVLSDKNKEVSKKYGALNILGMSKRKIVLIGQDGKVLFEKSVLPITYIKPEELLSDEMLKLLK